MAVELVDQSAGMMDLKSVEWSALMLANEKVGMLVYI